MKYRIPYFDGICKALLRTCTSEMWDRMIKKVELGQAFPPASQDVC